MKKIFVALAMLIGCAVFCSAKSNHADSDTLTAADMNVLRNAVKLVDDGMLEAAMTDFNALSAKYPDNYLVNYELMYNLYMMHRFKEAVKIGERMFKSKDVEPLCFQLVGNAYDIMGKPDKAIKTYEKGLKRFPDSGNLYLELGTVYNLQQKYDDALKNYNRGIEVEPNFASNYYRAAQLYSMSDNYKVWSMIYAEAEVLLAPGDMNRTAEMGHLIYDCLKENIHIEKSDSLEVNVTLTKSSSLTIDKNTKQVYVGFPGVYQGCLASALKRYLKTDTAFTMSLPQLIELRRGIVENYFSITDDMYGDSMYLLEYQKKIIDAGYWEAYNYFLFADVFTEEFDGWIESNEDSLRAFSSWYEGNRFQLGDGRSVSVGQIYGHYPSFDLAKALKLMHDLSRGAKSNMTLD